MSPRRQLTGAIAGCVAGAGLGLLAAGRPWARGAVSSPGRPTLSVQASGTSLVPLVAACALVGLAGAVALLASRGVLRRATALVVVAAAAGLVTSVVRVLADRTSALHPTVVSAVGRSDAVASGTTVTAWPWLALSGGLLLLACGLFVVVRGGAMPAMGARYEGPAAAEAVPAEERDGSRALWDSLDRGEDPTR